MVLLPIDEGGWHINDVGAATTFEFSRPLMVLGAVSLYTDT
jgi:hypothetical protein